MDYKNYCSLENILLNVIIGASIKSCFKAKIPPNFLDGPSYLSHLIASSISDSTTLFKN